MSNVENVINNIEPDQFMFSESNLKKIEHLKHLSSLPPTVMKKVHALRNIQLRTANLEAECHRKLYQVQKEYEDKHKENYAMRKAIVIGEYEPSEEECVCNISMPLPQDLSEKVNTSKTTDNNINIKGIPDFWLTILKYSMDSLVKEQDEPALKHLIDIRSVSTIKPEMSFILEFEFSPNEYFSNKVLRKQYILKCEPDPSDPFAFDGPEIKSCNGCNINWHPGKNLTIKVVKKKGSGSSQIIKNESFFNFFNPPKPIEDETDPLFEDVNIILDADYELANYLRDRIVPMAVLLYTGEIVEDTEVSSYASESPKGSEDEAELMEEDINYQRNNLGEGDTA